jgi:hypothetical protein
MTKITSVYNTCISVLTALFPTKDRIPNPYSLSDNDNPHLRNAWGIKHNGSERQSYELCKRRVKSSWSIVLTKEFLKLDTHETIFDDLTLALLEDAELVQGKFYETNNLNDSDIIAVNVTNISPVSTVFGDKFSYLSVECLMEIDYFENIK